MAIKTFKTEAGAERFAADEMRAAIPEALRAERQEASELAMGASLWGAYLMSDPGEEEEHKSCSLARLAQGPERRAHDPREAAFRGCSPHGAAGGEVMDGVRVAVGLTRSDAALILSRVNGLAAPAIAGATA